MSSRLVDERNGILEWIDEYKVLSKLKSARKLMRHV